MPPLHGGTNNRQASLPNLNLPGSDLNGNRRAHGVYKSSSPSVPLADQVQASSSMDIQQDQLSMISPGQPYPLCLGQYLGAYQCPGAVSSQSFGTAWPTPDPPDPNVFHRHPLSPYAQGYVNYPRGYVTNGGFPTNIGLRLTEFDPYDISNDDWLHLDDLHRV